MREYALAGRPIALDDSWDVIVVGGGPAGSAAATAAAREGARTLLIEAAGALGGMGTLGLVPWFCGYHDREKIIARGLAERVLDACRAHTPHLRKALEANPLAAPAIDPELLKRIYDQLVTEAGATVLFQSQVCAVEKAGEDAVDAIIVANKAGLTAYRAGMYVDCTGDGDVAAWAGAPFGKGAPSAEDAPSGETVAPGAMQPATHCFVIGNVDEYALNTGPRVHFYDPDSPIHKAVRSDKYPHIDELHSCTMPIGPGTIGFNTGHLYDVDNTDPASLSKALMLGRTMAAEYRDALAEFLPAFANSFLVATGALMGIRETRRIYGDYVLSADDYRAHRSFPDEICRNAYGIDVHGSRELARQRATMAIDDIRAAIESQVQAYPPGRSMGVPYRCLTPQGLRNVLVAGRCISTDRAANGSVRIMACCLNTGEAAGLAAAMAAAAGCDSRQVDTAALRGRLRECGAYLPEVDG
ncbi:MAG: FAD-dependent oxidoreductase [Candidatus Hydrogenedentes bacterium]|nr:FAD-dependent oxidoreductase [Candidatus Hydrogenedentota bacterium]